MKQKLPTVNKGGSFLICQSEDTNGIVLDDPVRPIKHFANVGFHPTIWHWLHPLVSEQKNQCTNDKCAFCLHSRKQAGHFKWDKGARVLRPRWPLEVLWLPSWLRENIPDGGRSCDASAPCPVSGPGWRGQKVGIRGAESLAQVAAVGGGGSLCEGRWVSEGVGGWRRVLELHPSDDTVPVQGSGCCAWWRPVGGVVDVQEFAFVFKGWRWGKRISIAKSQREGFEMVKKKKALGWIWMSRLKKRSWKWLPDCMHEGRRQSGPG